MRLKFNDVSYNLSFKSKNQLPLLMITKECYVNGIVDFAKVLFQINGSEFNKSFRDFKKRSKEIYRVVDLDMLCLSDDHVIEIVDSLEKAKEISAEHYYLNTSVEQRVRGKWKTVLVNGETWEEHQELMNILFHAGC